MQGFLVALGARLIESLLKHIASWASNLIKLEAKANRDKGDIKNAVKLEDRAQAAEDLTNILRK